VGHTLLIDAAYTYGERKPTKTHQRRSVEVIPPLARDLALLRPWEPSPMPWWRPTTGAGTWTSTSGAGASGARRPPRPGVKATPYDGRHTYASLLIHEGRSPLLVSAALGHASGELVWRRYAHVFEEARLAPSVAMVDAIEAARAELERAGLRPGCSQGAVRALRS
jgi:integrase